MRAYASRFCLKNPGDASGIEEALRSGTIIAEEVVAVIGKTHGNGLVNDYTRGYLTLSLSIAIAVYTEESPLEVRARIPFIFSGGVEGVLSPHYVVFCVSRAESGPEAAPFGAQALAIGVAFTPRLEPRDIGRQRQIDLTAEAVMSAMASAAITSAADVHLVQVKGPAFDMSELATAKRSDTLLSDNPGKLMAYGRAASAIGVAKALGEIAPEAAIEQAVLRDFESYSSVASISAGIEVSMNEIVVLGLSACWSGNLTIDHMVMRDALDVESIHHLVARLGFEYDHQLSAADASRIQAAFVKCEAHRGGTIRGRPHMMLNDGDVDQQRHIRAAVGAVAASVLNETAIFISGGAEHQGPDGGGLIALLVERPQSDE